MSESRSKVFISYSRADGKVTKALARDLQAAGVQVWMDQEDISIGERWSTAIQNALEEAYAMVLVLSPDSMASPNVEDEFTYFLDQRKPIVPVMVRPTRIHFQLHRLQWIDFTQGDRDKAYEQLLRALHSVGVEFAPTEEAMKAGTRQSSILSQLMNEIDSQKRQVQRRRRALAVLATVLAVAILIVIGFLALPGEDAKPTPKPTREFVTGRVDGPDVVMYEQPSRDSRVVVENIPDRTPLIVRQRTPDERFLFVEYGQIRGFVLARDLEVGEISEIGIYISPTPEPTATPTEFVLPTPTVTPSPTPETVMNPAANECIINVAADSSPQPVLLGPSSVLFAALDSIKPGESFVASARSGAFWLYIGIGWVDRNRGGITLNNVALCDQLPEDETLTPNRIRPFIKDLPLASDLLARDPISPEGLSGDALLAAQAWNNYGSLLANLGDLLSLDANLLLSVIVEDAMLEGSDDPNDLMDIRFEADLFQSFLLKEQLVNFDSNFYVDPNDPTHHQFRVQKADPFMEYHGDRALEWQAFQIARQINEDAALRAVRYGQRGLLGDSFAVIGYITPQAMYDAFMSNPDARVIGKLDFLKSNTLMLGALRFGNWDTLAQLYDVRVGAAFVQQARVYFQAIEALR